jgi:glycosyltransferase involved in cell wall biosynthesis/cyclopropane fatty-acyl-phospholipid synthase-like methyltransferase
MQPRIGILVVAYNAASTLAQVLDRIPRQFVPRISDVLVCDDSSQDATYLVGLGYQKLAPELPLTVIRNPENLGYGGNQKACYRWAIEHDLDIVVLLHGDGQYAPEILPDIVRPLEAGTCDAVLGSRMLERGAARRGGMPMYKLVGNRILTRFQNAVVGSDLSEWHSGYRAYSVAALRKIPFERNVDGFAFDTQIILQLVESGARIEEIPIPTYYGDEICYVKGMQYAYDVSRQVVRYRTQKMGFGGDDMTFAASDYEEKVEPDSSHSRIESWMRSRPPSRVLDLGCSSGVLGARLRELGHTVVGIDRYESEQVRDRVDDFVAADLVNGIPDDVGGDYDVVIAADVLEHLARPEHLLADIEKRLAPGGSVIASVPNFAHWYPRARVAAGRFDYDRRGILDRDHVRFFTKRSFDRLLEQAGYRVRRFESIGLPFEVFERGGDDTSSASRHAVARQVDRVGTWMWPTMFAYQFLYEAEPDRGARPG